MAPYSREGTYTTRSNVLCVRDKPCPIAARMVVGPMRRWEDELLLAAAGERGYSRSVWCIRCSAKAQVSVNLNEQDGQFQGMILPPRPKAKGSHTSKSRRLRR